MNNILFKKNTRGVPLGNTIAVTSIPNEILGESLRTPGSKFTLATVNPQGALETKTISKSPGIIPALDQINLSALKDVKSFPGMGKVLIIGGSIIAIAFLMFKKKK